MTLQHGRIVCECGILIAQCRCMHNQDSTEVRSPCTHKRVAVGDVNPSRKKARHIIIDSHIDSEIYTTDGLAFTVGVAALECDTTRDPTRLLQVAHPNGVVLYYVRYDSDTNAVTVTKVM